MSDSPQSPRVYPFSAIVGQESMKLALVLNAINPAVGGLLIRGEKGTAKSTAVRALASLLPEIEATAGCPWSCNPNDVAGLCDSCRDSRIEPRTRRVRVVELPLNATEEMVLGGLDFSASITDGVRSFQPGLMARANRGILYIDEVNLLSDHLVDIILDVSASGENVVEREGISHRHPARFVLVGSMNPEEGELRPQLLDRFGLCVQVQGERDVALRVEVLRRRESFDRAPEAFCRQFAREDGRLRQRIAAARRVLPSVGFPERLQEEITETCVGHRVAGHRADIVIAHAARALAAFEGRHEAAAHDVRRAAALALPHRTREPVRHSDSLPGTRSYHNPPRVTKPVGYPEDYPDQEPAHASVGDSPMGEIVFEAAQRPIRRFDCPEAIFDIGPVFKVKEIGHRADRLFRQGSGRRSRTRTRQKKGRYISSIARRLTDDVALDATIRAAAPYQLNRKTANGLVVTIRSEDIREKVRETRTGNFLLFVVDASGSMGAKGRIVASKGAIMSLLKDAYQKRDRVAMVSFRKQEAVVNLPPTSSIHLARQLLKELPVGGKTPLAAGLRKG